MKTQQILIVEDDINSSTVLSRILRNEGYAVDYVSDAENAYTLTMKGDYDLLIIDLVLPKMDGLSLLKKIKKRNSHILCIIVTGYGSISSAVEALKAGANDFLEKPLVPEKLLHVIHKVFEEQRLKNEILALKSDLVQRNHYTNIIGKHSKMQIIFQLIDSLKDSDAAVLITGETGTGKELVARAIHFQSRRRHQPFVAINCASIPETLFESELFGFEQGAFTGATKQKLGKLEQAHGGTVLLDEIGDMPMAVQGKLLRSLQEKKIERLGSGKVTSIPLDIRIISATNKNLPLEVSQRKFRTDLFYRLNVVPIHLPPLRERIEDIPLLVDHFLEKLNGNKDRPAPRFSQKALSTLMSHPWPGNVREFENVIERTLILNKNHLVEDIPFLPAMGQLNRSEAYSRFMDTDLSLKEVRNRAITELEKQYLDRVLKRHNGSVKQTAEHAKIDVRTVHRKMRDYGLDKWEFK